MTQVELATRLGISSSYVNLIENNRRPLTAALLIRLAEIFRLDMREFGGEEDAALSAATMAALADPVLEREGLTNADVRELTQAHPNIARAVVALHRAYQTSQASVDVLAARLSAGEELGGLGGLGARSDTRAQLPPEEVHEFIQQNLNHFASLEEAAEALWREESLTLESLPTRLVEVLKDRHGIQVEVVRSDGGSPLRSFAPEQRRLFVSDLLPPHSRAFQIAHQLAILEDLRAGEEGMLTRLMGDSALLSLPESRTLARVALASYFAGAVAMPYSRFLAAARACRYDVERLGRDFHASFEQVAHRLTTLRRVGEEGVPFHLIRVDVAGNISKRFSASGIHFARFSGACPRWNVFAALLTPGRIHTQVSRFADGTTYFCIARTLHKDGGGYHAQRTVQSIGLGCEARFARELVYSDGVNLSSPEAAVAVGVSCRLCERADCAQRAMPSIKSGMRIDENVRNVSLYAPAGE